MMTVMRSSLVAAAMLLGSVAQASAASVTLDFNEFTSRVSNFSAYVTGPEGNQVTFRHVAYPNAANQINGFSAVTDNAYGDYIADERGGLLHAKASTNVYTISFEQPVNTVELYIASLGGSLSGQYATFEFGGQTVTQALTRLSATNFDTFYRVVLSSTEGFNSITLTDGTRGHLVIDDFTYGVSEVPLPGALPLFGGGIAMMGYLGWRRRKAA